MKVLELLISIDKDYISSDMDWEDYFSDFIGVTKKNTEPIEVRILIKTELQAAYIHTNPLHQTQKSIKEVADGFETSINVIPNYELEKLILSFGENIKVLSPDSLKNIIQKRIDEMYNNRL